MEKCANREEPEINSIDKPMGLDDRCWYRVRYSPADRSRTQAKSQFASKSDAPTALSIMAVCVIFIGYRQAAAK